MSAGRRKTLLRAIVLCCAALALLLGFIIFIDRWQNEQYQETRGTGTEEFMNAGTVLWKGEKYRKKPGVTTILIGGIDREAEEQQGVGTDRYRNGGQADFLLLLAIDQNGRQIRQLQIDRDTMAEVTVLSVFGQETGTRIMQICLSHAFGANKEENASYTVRAVRGLMNELEIDGYYMLDYGAINILNEALGGLTVTVPDDMTSVNPLWEKGSAVTLSGGEAETFVRTRKTVGEGTNEERMKRQNEFMRSAVTAIRLKLSQDAAFGSQLLSSLKSHATTGFSDQQLLEEIQKTSDCEILPVEYLEGDYGIGEDGYVEFHVREGSAESWIMRNLYTKE